MAGGSKGVVGEGIGQWDLEGGWFINGKRGQQGV